MKPLPVKAVDISTREQIIGWYANVGNAHLVYITPPGSAMLCSRPIVPSTVCACTGHRDEAGDLIYENDIVYDTFADEVGVVAWNAEDACFCVHYQGVVNTFDVIDSHDLRILDSIFNNPYLTPWYK